MKDITSNPCLALSTAFRAAAEKLGIPVAGIHLQPFGTTVNGKRRVALSIFLDADKNYLSPKKAAAIHRIADSVLCDHFRQAWHIEVLLKHRLSELSDEFDSGHVKNPSLEDLKLRRSFKFN